MSVEKARALLDEWIIQNVAADPCPEPEVRARQLADRCLEAAMENRISKAELEEAAGQDLVQCMMDAQVAATGAKLDMGT
jgi:hypothetical protein